jgi:uncharacterized protein DUF4328
MNPSPYRAPFTSAHGRALMVKILLVIGAITAGASLLAETLSLAVPPVTDDPDLGDNPMSAVLALLIGLLAVLEFLVYVTTAVFFLMWLYRANNNVRAFDPWRRLEYSGGWAVGSFFIPFANLVIPYRAVREVWQKSGPPDEALLSEPSPPASFPIWWTFWLLASFAGNISTRVAFSEKVSPSAVTTISIIASALFIVAALLAYLVVDAIDDRQEETSRKINLGTFSGPPPPPTNLSMPDVITTP